MIWWHRLGRNMVPTLHCGNSLCCDECVAFIFHFLLVPKSSVRSRRDSELRSSAQKKEMYYYNEIQ